MDDKPGAEAFPIGAEAARRAALALAAEGIGPGWLRSQAAGEHRAMLLAVADELEILGGTRAELQSLCESGVPQSRYGII